MAGTATTPISATTRSLRTNYARIGHAAQEVFPKLLQEILAIKEPQHKLYSDVYNNAFLKGNLRPDEWLMINKASAHGYANFDISLCSKLIRNLNLVPPPTKTWNSNLKPTSTETTPGDDILRIRLTRNEILHRGNANVSDAELVAYFVLFKDIARRLEPFLGKAKDEIVKMFTELESCSMDEKTEKMYLEELEILRTREIDLIETVEDLKGDVKVVTKDVKEVKKDVKVMTKDVIKAKEDVKVVTKDVIEVKKDVKEVTKDVKEVKDDVKVMTKDVIKAKEDVKLVTKDVIEVKEDVKVVTKDVIEVKEDVKVVTKDVIKATEDVKVVTKDVVEVKEDVKVVTKDVIEVKKDVKEVTTDVKEVKDDVKVMTKDVIKAKEDVKVVTKDVIEVKEDVKVVTKNVVEVKKDVKVVTKDVIEVKEDVKVVTKDVIKAKEDVKVVTKDVIEVKEDVKEVKEDVDSLKYPDFMKAVIAEWQKENKFFVRTRAVDEILKSLTENHVYCITGNPGIGKSASMHHVALNLQENHGYQIFQCFYPSDICKYFKEGQKQVFVFDDVCGKYTLLQSDVEEWIKQHDLIKTVITSGNNTKIFTTSRSQIVRDPQFKGIKLFQEKCCDLSADAYSLSYDIKLQIAKQYLPEHVVDTIKGELNKYELLPLMFKLLLEKNKMVDARNFFKNPIQQYTDELNELKNANDKTKFCALFLVVINNGFVDASLFTAEESQQVRSTRKNIFEACGVNRGILRKRMQDQFDSLLDFFLKRSPNGQGYTTIHDTMLDFLCSYFGIHFQIPFIKYADQKVLTQRTQLKSIHEHVRVQYTILIRQENEEEYMNRIVKDLLLGKACNGYIYHSFDFTYCERCIIKLTKFIRNLDVDNVKQLINVTDKNKFSLLILACKIGEIRTVKFFVENGAAVDPDFGDITDNPLRVVCGNSLLKVDIQYEIIKLLLDNGANVNRIVDNRMFRSYPLSAFLEKTLFNCEESIFLNEINEIAIHILELLIDKGHNVNTVYDNLCLGRTIPRRTIPRMTTPLITACKIGDIHFIKLLIEKGAAVDPNIDDIGETPLTAVCGHLWLKFVVQYKIIKLLVDNGANVNRMIDNGKTRFSPLSTFLDKTKYKCENMYLTEINEILIHILELLMNKVHHINTAYGSLHLRVTPLTTACRIGDIRFIKLLIEKGADVDPNFDDIKETPLTAACRDLSLSFDVQYEIIKLLLDKGANVNRIVGNRGSIVYPLSAFLDKTESTCKNGLINVIDEIAINILELLIDNGDNVDIVYCNRDLDWTTPLTTACRIGDIRFIKLLIDRADVDPNIDDTRYMKTPLTAICGHPSLALNVQHEIIKLLLYKGAKARKMDGSRNYPIISVVEKVCNRKRKQNPQPVTEPFNIIKLLLENGADINAVNKDGESAFTIAYNSCDLNFMTFLIDNGANVSSEYTALVDSFLKENNIQCFEELNLSQKEAFECYLKKEVMKNKFGENYQLRCIGREMCDFDRTCYFVIL